MGEQHWARQWIEELQESKAQWKARHDALVERNAALVDECQALANQRDSLKVWHRQTLADVRGRIRGIPELAALTDKLDVLLAQGAADEMLEPEVAEARLDHEAVHRAVGEGLDVAGTGLMQTEAGKVPYYASEPCTQVQVRRHATADGGWYEVIDVEPDGSIEVRQRWTLGVDGDEAGCARQAEAYAEGRRKLLAGR